jgi:hypothetical protein
MISSQNVADSIEAYSNNVEIYFIHIMSIKGVHNISEKNFTLNQELNPEFPGRGQEFNSQFGLKFFS